ncbi:twin-arginine translocase subunit TatC [Sulfolobus acidocaldarius]|uniref:Sec-independent protein translocase protein TatC n=4 Tax=Sulfolobus acidocaldarius TaxID=2285 RepID=Q4JC08_SULAC|nr:twin-arginine translocase subunit TatC [Sulfolobus acidocaldarius]AAY79671.1 translocase 6TM [Sulfolobus acidocaldarius DSM 639]AGE70229.1 translocase 6TM [Sulfolobus acidocaldarius N8]AGE72504.1 translocase 6TM [Sulfolobus acidocaldarius Ron12/I]ALU29365.1 translocase [Sulfolobus acidocaldarius]ALU32094.1 translocase [Sulfolobus acidocaldarius]
MSYQKAREDKEQPLIEHIRELLRRTRRVIISFLVFLTIYTTFGITTIKIGTYSIPILYPTLYDSISVQFTRVVLMRPIPKDLILITLSPFEALLTTITVSVYLSIFSSLPILLREFWAFVSPGLYEHEKRTFRKLVTPGMLLFVAGSAFAYFMLLPFMLIFIYRLDVSLGVEPTLGFNSYISTIILLMAGTGIAFEMPLIMYMLTLVGLIKSSTWFKNWRWGVLISFIVAYIISPGTTGGIIETIIGIILSMLYFGGAYASKIAEKSREKKKNLLMTK